MAKNAARREKLGIGGQSRDVTANISMPITINVGTAMATPGAIAGAVQGAGNSITSEIKKSMSDGGY